MLETLYYNVLRLIRDKTLAFYFKFFGHKNTPSLVNLISWHAFAIFPTVFTMLGAQNVNLSQNPTNVVINYAGVRPIYVIFFEFLPISFQMKNNDDMRL